MKTHFRPNTQSSRREIKLLLIKSVVTRTRPWPVGGAHGRTDLWKLMVVRASFKSPAAAAAAAVPLPRLGRSSLLVSSVSLCRDSRTSDRPNSRNTVASGNASSGRPVAGQRNAAAHIAYSSILGVARVTDGKTAVMRLRLWRRCDDCRVRGVQQSSRRRARRASRARRVFRNTSPSTGNFPVLFSLQTRSTRSLPCVLHENTTLKVVLTGLDGTSVEKSMFDPRKSS